MNCTEFKEHAAAYTLGALDPAEREAVEAHLREPRHEGCLEELRRMADTAQGLADALPPIKPGPQVWQGIAARIGASAERAPAGGRRWRDVVGWAVAIAAVVALFFLFRRKDELEAKLEQTEDARLAASASEREQTRLASECRTALAKAQLGDVQRNVLATLEREGTQLAQFGAFPGAPAGYGGNMIMNAADKRAWFIGTGFKPQPGKTYQLWVLPTGNPADARPAGLLQPDDRGNAVAGFDPTLFDQAKVGFAVSVEEHPDDDTVEGPLLLAKLPSKTQ